MSGTETLPGHRSEAVNTNRNSANVLHSDHGARRLGLTRAVVPSEVLYEYLCRPAVSQWGREWFERGTIQARFHKPVFHGQYVSVESGPLQTRPVQSPESAGQASADDVALDRPVVDHVTKAPASSKISDTSGASQSGTTDAGVDGAGEGAGDEPAGDEPAGDERAGSGGRIGGEGKGGGGASAERRASDRGASGGDTGSGGRVGDEGKGGGGAAGEGRASGGDGESDQPAAEGAAAAVADPDGVGSTENQTSTGPKEPEPEIAFAELTCSTDDGVIVASATVSLLPRPAAPPQKRYLPVPLAVAEFRPRAGPVAFAALDQLGSIERKVSLAQSIAWLAQLSGDPGAYRAMGVAPAVDSVRDANCLFDANVQLGPWLHYATDAVHFSPARDGESVSTRGSVVDVYERDGNHFAVLDLLVVAEGRRPVVHLTHTVIWKLAAAAGPAAAIGSDSK